MNELKLVVGDEAESAGGPSPDLSKLNPIDALNRRDIELIKRSLATMQKDCADMRGAIVALHGRDGRMPSKRFFLAFGVVAFVALAALTTARPQIGTALQHVPVVAKTTGGDLTQ